MNMQEALEWAADYAERNELFKPVANQRGYTDGWKPPTPAEKVSVIKDLAEAACDDSSGFVPSESYQANVRDWKLLGNEVGRLEGVMSKIQDQLSFETEKELEGIHSNLFDLAKRNDGI